tara:strand:+ start:1358 stop:1552 length:195 start_codon:yes stop_codon:yes gene_type:complete
MELHEKYEIEIDTYIKWFRNECCDPYDELKWIIDLLLNSRHKEDIIDVLKTTHEGYVRDSNNKY